MDIQSSTNRAADDLLKLYGEDKKPFIADSAIRFPDRADGFAEVSLLRELFFPNYWNGDLINRHQLQIKISELSHLFLRGISPYLTTNENVSHIVAKVILQLPKIRVLLKKDVEAAFKGDPAAKTYTEIIRAYPGFTAIQVHRVSNALFLLGAGSYARELSEHIHSKTGIDIHPGAKIGEYFFIDHGTGVVIGETTKIGNWVRIYQGVTLGALSLSKEEVEELRDARQRHPTIKDDVIIYANATILGGDTEIGKGAVIGGNVWITESVPPNTKVIIKRPELKFIGNDKKGDESK